MMKDLNKDKYGGKDQDVPTDIKLVNRDQEIVIGGEREAPAAR
jgi:hypothetical protein